MFRVLTNGLRRAPKLTKSFKNITKITAISAIAFKFYSLQMQKRPTCIANMAPSSSVLSNSGLNQAKNGIVNFASNDAKTLATGILLANGYILIPVTTKKIINLLKKRSLRMQKASDFGKDYKAKINIAYEIVEDLSNQGILVAKLTKVKIQISNF